MSDEAFQKGMADFLSSIQEHFNKQRLGREVSVLWGRKFAKIAMRGPASDLSVYCFVSIETGDIYKAESWERPYVKGKGAVRGNVLNPDSYKGKDLARTSWLYQGG